MTERKVLVPMDVHNTFRECRGNDQNNLRNSTARVDSFVAPLLTMLSKKRPRWTFVAEGSGSFSYERQCCYYDNFWVVEDGEHLGRIWVESNWRNRDKKFAFDNARLRSKRQRGSHTETKDIKKATKTILENMYATTPSEFMVAARSTSVSRVQSKLMEYHREYRTTKDALMPVMENFVLDQPEVLKAYAPQVASKIDTLLAQRVDVAMAFDVQKRVEDQKTTLLVERGSKVYVEPAQTPGQFLAHDLNELSDRFKQVIGVLKLAPVGTLVSDLGFRADEHIFVAFDLDTVKDIT